MKSRRSLYLKAGITIISLGVVGITLANKFMFSKSNNKLDTNIDENKPMLENPFEDFLTSYYIDLEGAEFLVVNDELLSTQEQDMFLYDIKHHYEDMYPLVFNITVVNTKKELSYIK